MRELIANLIEKLCAKMHWMHRIPVPESWFEQQLYATWRGRVCNALYGCHLTDVAAWVGRWDAEHERTKGTPWHHGRPHPLGTDRDDNPYGDGMDAWGDPTDWVMRCDRNEAHSPLPFWPLVARQSEFVRAQ